MVRSYQEIRDLLEKALADKLGADKCWWVVDMYPDHCIYESDEHYYQCPFSIADDGAVTLGTATEVERKVAYMPLNAASQILAAVGDPGAADWGYTWRVQVNEYGPGKDGRINWTREPLVAAIGLIEGARVFALNDSQHQAAGKPFGKSVKEIIGWLKNVTDTGTAIEADLCILKSAQWLRDGLVDSFDRGKSDLFGLSFDAMGSTVTKLVAGKKMKQPVEIKSVEVDIVYDPTNNGKFLRLAAAVEAGQKGDTEMFEKLLAALQSKRPELYTQIQAGISAGTMTQDQAVEQIAAATVKDAGGDSTNQALVAAAMSGIQQLLAATPAGPSEELQQMQLMACSMTLRETLTASKLPEPVQEKLRASFTGVIFKEESLQAAIKAEKEMLDKLTASGQVRGLGEVRVVRETGEKLQAAVDGLFRVPVADAMKDVPIFTSIRAAYAEITGDHEVRGYQDQNSRLQAAFDTSTFSYLLGNALYRRMVADYRETSDFGLSRIISNVRNAKDFRPLQAIRIAYYGDIPDVNPEDLDYADLGTLSDEKMEYSLNQKGGIITITRKMIINDDMTAINRIVSRLPRAARRTKAKRAWNKFINNDTYKGDSVATFHASHNNLGSTAYALASAVAARTAIAKQAEPGSSERLYLRPKTLIIPTDLWDAAVTLNQNSAVTTGNSMYQYFGANNEGIIEVPFMTDVTDWMMFADPQDVEIMEVAYLNGQPEPEMFVADQPTIGQFFVADKIQYKIRDEYEFEIMDFRGAYKAVVAG